MNHPHSQPNTNAACLEEANNELIVNSSSGVPELRERKEGLQKKVEDALQILKRISEEQEMAQFGVAKAPASTPKDPEQSSIAQGNDSDDGDDDDEDNYADEIISFDDDTIQTTFTHRIHQAQQDTIVLENIPHIPDVEAVTIGKDDLEDMEKEELINIIDALMRGSAQKNPTFEGDRTVVEIHDERTQQSFKVILPPWLQKSNTERKETSHKETPTIGRDGGSIVLDNFVEPQPRTQHTFEPILPPWFDQKSKKKQAPVKKTPESDHGQTLDEKIGDDTAKEKVTLLPYTCSEGNLQKETDRPDKDISMDVVPNVRQQSKEPPKLGSQADMGTNHLSTRQRSSRMPEKYEISTKEPTTEISLNGVPNVMLQPKEESSKQPEVLSTTAALSDKSGQAKLFKKGAKGITRLARPSFRKATSVPSKLVPISENEQIIIPGDKTGSSWDYHHSPRKIRPEEPKRSISWRLGVVKSKSNTKLGNQTAPLSHKNVQVLFYTPGTAEGVFLAKQEPSSSSSTTSRLDQINARWHQHYNAADNHSSDSTVSLTDHSSHGNTVEEDIRNIFCASTRTSTSKNRKREKLYQ